MIYTEFVNILVSQTRKGDFLKDLTTYFFTSVAASINRRWVAKSKATVRVAYKKIHIVNIIIILQIL